VVKYNLLMKNHFKLTILSLLISSISFGQMSRLLSDIMVNIEVGTTTTPQKLIGKSSAGPGTSFGGGIDKYLDFKRVRDIPISVGLHYNYNNISIQNELEEQFSFTEHHITFPIRFDLLMLGVPIGKSSKFFCRTLTNSITFGLYPGFTIGNHSIESKWTLPIELAYSFSMENGGRDRSFLITGFARVDTGKRYEKSGDKYRLNTFGVRLQMANYKMYMLSNFN
jgi:hypothetical protein